MAGQSGEARGAAALPSSLPIHDKVPWYRERIFLCKRSFTCTARLAGSLRLPAACLTLDYTISDTRLHFPSANRRAQFRLVVFSTSGGRVIVQSTAIPPPYTPACADRG